MTKRSSKNIPYPKRVAIAVVSSNWLTLTGAPSSLASLMEFSKALDEVPKIDTLESKGGHMEFLPPVDIDTLLGDSPLLATPITSKARILSPASCKPYAHSTLRSLLSEMLLDTASRVLRIDDAVGACITALEGKRPVTLATAGASASGYAPIVGRALGSRNIAYQSDQHRSTVKSIPSRGGSGLVAIVGMSARLPGSDTVDAFFEDLLQGKIQMKKVL